MGSEPADTETAQTQPVASRADGIDDRASDQFFEQLTAAQCLGLLHWARRVAPRLLGLLVASYLAKEASEVERNHQGQAAPICLVPVNCGRPKCSETKTLKATEREHIARVLSEARTLNEAAKRLGIHFTTLWRKRKLYNLGLASVGGRWASLPASSPVRRRRFELRTR
jgi:DNA-binding NtrC family response regulator